MIAPLTTKDVGRVVIYTGSGGLRRKAHIRGFDGSNVVWLQVKGERMAAVRGQLEWPEKKHEMLPVRP